MSISTAAFDRSTTTGLGSFFARLLAWLRTAHVSTCSHEVYIGL
jgi:hypothetical protein